jgi:endonuclease/exonuclease/phosphatase family metal-dependent hydrolase
MSVGVARFVLAALFLLSALVAPFGCNFSPAPSPGPAAEAGEAGVPAAAGQYLFCFWNVENLFDDQNDKRQSADEPYDNWFSNDRNALEEKLDRLCTALLKMNHGRGPDILALVEVESVHAAELLLEALNKRLRDPALHYQHVLMKNLIAGRHIAPAIITRLPVRGDRTRLLGKKQRILEGHIHVNGHELIVLATHWTSRVSDEKGEARARYADQIYGAFHGMYKRNSQVDVLICGDFNDPPDAVSVTQHLHATGNVNALTNGAQPRLFNLMAGKDPARFGTHYYRGWWIFDQIVVSPGMLAIGGWSCEPNSVHVDNSLTRPGDPQRRPWRFGDRDNNGPRGYSDHFPVTVRLRVQEG